MCCVHTLKVEYLGLILLLNIILILSTTKKVSELSFYSVFKIYILMVSILGFAFIIIKSIIISAVMKVSSPQSRNFFTMKELLHIQGIFHCREIFSQTKNFFTAMNIFHSHEYFPQTRNIFTNKELFYSHENFPQIRNFSSVKELFHNHGNFPQSRNFLTVMEIFHKQATF